MSLLHSCLCFLVIITVFEVHILIQLLFTFCQTLATKQTQITGPDRVELP